MGDGLHIVWSDARGIGQGEEGWPGRQMWTISDLSPHLGGSEALTVAKDEESFCLSVDSSRIQFAELVEQALCSHRASPCPK